MDIRKKKTLRAISQAFCALRKQKKLEAITVTELCARAEISKATFYLHYRDIFDLSMKLQQEVIQRVFSRIENPMTILTDPIEFLTQIVSAFESEKEWMNTLFSDSQAAEIPIKIESYLKDYIFAQAPELKDDAKTNIYLSYHIQGSYYAYLENEQKWGYSQIIKTISEIQGTQSPLTNK